MSDERIREAERRWRAEGTDDAEAAYILERVRSGDLPFARVAAAALLGYPAAVIAARNAAVAHPAHDFPADTMILDDLCNEMRLNWPVTFTPPLNEDNPDLRAVIILQRRVGGARVRVRAGRGVVTAPNPRDTRIVLSVEVSSAERDVILGLDGVPAGDDIEPMLSQPEQYLPNCRSLGFPHSYPRAVLQATYARGGGRTCELCGARDIVRAAVGAPVPMAPPVEPASDPTLPDFIDRMRRQLATAVAVPRHLMIPADVPAPMRPMPIGTINYLTGEFEMALPPETSIQWMCNYTYEGGLHAYDTVSGDVHVGRGGRLNYSPIKPSTLLMQSPILDVVDDGQGNLVPQRLADAITPDQLREAFGAPSAPTNFAGIESYDDSNTPHHYDGPDDDYDPRDPGFYDD